MSQSSGKHEQGTSRLTKVGLLFWGALAFTQWVPTAAVAQSQRSSAVAPSASGASRPRPVASNPYEEAPVPTPDSKNVGAKSERPRDATVDHAPATKHPPAAGTTGAGTQGGVAGESSSNGAYGASSGSAAGGAGAGESPSEPSVEGEQAPNGETATEHKADGETAKEHAGSGDGGAKAPPRAKPSVGRSLSVGRSNTSEPQPMFGTFEGTYVLGGLASGVSFGPKGVYLGGELSVVRQFQEFAWLGAYVDGVYDFGRDQKRFSIGPEVGWSAFGLDGGYLLALDGAGAHSGVTVRPLISIGFVTAYGRVSHLFEPKHTWLEAGLLLKYPFEL